MTEVAFHFNAPDKVAYTCRLLRKATSAGAKVVVSGQAEALEALDGALWALSPVDFVPHCRFDAPPAVLERSAVVLATHAGSSPHHNVLVNVGDEVPAGFERFDRLIEVVTLDAADRQAARERWKHYAERGYAMVRHDLAGTAAGQGTNP